MDIADMLNHFGVDVENDTLPTVFKKLSQAGLGSFQTKITNEDNSSFGLLILSTEPEILPYIEKAFADFEEENEQLTCLTDM